MKKERPVRVRIMRYSELLKRKVVEEVESGAMTPKEAARHYGIVSRRSVDKWVWLYGKKKYQSEIVRVTMKSEHEKIEELKAALGEELLRRRVYAKQLEIYEKYVPDLKKKLDTKRLKAFEENQEKIDQFR